MIATTFDIAMFVSRGGDSVQGIARLRKSTMRIDTATHWRRATRQSIDVLVKKANENPFKPFGTWTKVF
jgi:hypothetical protein